MSNTDAFLAVVNPAAGGGRCRKLVSEALDRLRAGGVKLDEPYSKTRHKSFASAGLTDPWGVSIELTEGLNRF